MAPRAIAGISGARQNAAVALAVNGELLAFCEEERVTRVRRAGLTPGVVPAEALHAVLQCAGLQPGAIRRYVTAEAAAELPIALPTIRLDHHQAHAATAFYLSPFDEAAILVCDNQPARAVSVWRGMPDGLVQEAWPQSSRGLASIYAEGATLFGFRRGEEHQLEALARLDNGGGTDRLSDLLTCTDGVLTAAPGWQDAIAQWLAAENPDNLRHRARVAGAFQRRVGELLVQLAGEIRQRTGARRLCLGGGLFYNTYFTTRLRLSGVFDDVSVAPNPGNAGLAIGAALSVAAGEGIRPRRDVSPFLGPEYDAEQIKQTLDNCKLSYECLGEHEVVDSVAAALARGLLVGWFQGRMEWGHRALGNRSILASPLSPYVLDNLNVFLKHRERYRAYGVSVPEERAAEFFSGPPTSRFMEYEYRPLDPDLFKAVMPEGTAAIRVQTVPDRPSDAATARFRRLHEQFGRIAGVPVLVNTSFNGFAEPIVCSPRDAIRVFFGTGLDLLALDRFVIRK